MKILKKSSLCLVFLLMNNYCLFGAQRVSLPFRMLSTSCIVPKLNHISLQEQKREQSSAFNCSKYSCCSLQESFSVLAPLTNEQNQENYLTQYAHLLKLYEHLLKVKEEIDDRLKEQLGAVVTDSGSNKAGQKNRLFSEDDGSKIMSSVLDNLVNTIMSFFGNPPQINQVELRIILNLYGALVHQPKDGIVNVLIGSINTPESELYNDVMAHVKSKGSDLSTYRNIYAKVSKFLGKKGMKAIYRIIDENLIADCEQAKTALPNQVFIEQAEKSGLALSKNCLADRDCETNPVLDNQRNCRNSIGLYVTDSSDRFLKKDDDKSKISTKECMRLNRLFTLLPQYHSNSITRIMLGKTKPNKRSPVWMDILSAIEQINQEAAREGDTQTIDLNYFRAIYSLARENVGKKSKNLYVSNFSDNVLQTKDGLYSITKKEQKMLNRLFTLLPQYHSNSITRILLGNTKSNKRAPVWMDLLSAIEKINQEAAIEGEAITIDLNYFRKLQWLSVRVTGKGGHR